MTHSQHAQHAQHKTPEYLTNMLAMRAAILAQTLDDVEVLQNELRVMRDELANLPYDSFSKRSKLLAQMEDRKISLLSMRNIVTSSKNKVKDILESIRESREAGGDAIASPNSPNSPESYDSDFDDYTINTGNETK